MDADKDGILGKSDLRAAHDIVGRMCSEKELDEMLSDAPGPINFTTLLTMFGERMSGGIRHTSPKSYWISSFHST
jgi:Ca2+-binding EF-hand superfamily protein